jgi:hypothetical protein
VVLRHKKSEEASISKDHLGHSIVKYSIYIHHSIRILHCLTGLLLSIECVTCMGSVPSPPAFISTISAGIVMRFP